MRSCTCIYAAQRQRVSHPFEGQRPFLQEPLDSEVMWAGSKLDAVKDITNRTLGPSSIKATRRASTTSGGNVRYELSLLRYALRHEKYQWVEINSCGQKE